MILRKECFLYHLLDRTQGMDAATAESVLTGAAADGAGVLWLAQMRDIAGIAGVALLWIAAAMTLITGWDYFRKALPFLKEPT